MIFDGEMNDNIYLLDGRKKAPFAPMTREIVKFKRGHRLKRTTFELLEIIQPIGFAAKTKENAFEIKDQISEWLVKKDIAPLEFSQDPGRTYMVVIDGTLDDLEKRHWLWEGTIKFICFETLGYSHDLNITTSFNSFEIKGQKETPWTSTTLFSEAQSSFKIETGDGDHITLNYNFIQGDVLTIDYKKRKVKLNENDLAVSISLNTRWFELTPGDMELKASHETTVSYTERYY